MKIRALFIALALAVFPVAAQEEPVSPERAQQIRERYEQVLIRTPMQDSAFDRVYASYLEAEGVEAWVAKLKPAEGEPTKENWVLLGRIQERQFKTDEAIVSLEKAKELGVQDPQLDLLMGRLYYENGQDGKAAALLTTALEQPIDPEARSSVVRILGNLYMRQGKRDEAITAWKRLAEDNPGDTFAQTELAEIYEDNRMWEESIAAYSQLSEASANDPYQRCRALRAIGRARIAMEAYPEAIAAFEQALDLVSPGNWLFEDLKMRLVGVYQDLGDLQGLATYLNEKLEANPADTEFRDLLAETYTRMTKFAEAEAEHKKILERDPSRIATHEHLITLYERMERPDDVTATYETLIAQYPTEPDYLRRLGEVYLRRNQPDQAKAAWRRVIDATPTASQHAQLAEWMEMYEFAPEAIAEYEAALAMEPNREWTFKLAALKHAGGEGDAAKALWTSVLKEDSPAAERAEVASILETFKYIPEAEALLAQAHTQDPANLEYAQALAKNLMEQEKFDAALPLFEQMANQTENEYFQDRGEGGLLDAYGKLGILAEKKQEWEDAVRANPEDTNLLMRLARMYGRSGDNTSALGLYERCVELKPEDANYVKALADAYTRGSRIEEAIELYHKLIAMDANRAGGYYRELLDIYLKADFKDEAIETAKKVVELSPADAEAYLNLGQVYMNYQQYDDGLSAYRGALRLSPDEPDYYRQYGQALQSQDRLGEAQDAFRKMLDTAKEDETRLQAVNALAQIHLREGKLESLLAEFQSRVRSTPKRLAAYQELGAIHVQAGDSARSLEILEGGYNAVDDKGEALKSLVRASYEAQDFEKVVRYFEELIALSGKATAFEYERLGQVYAQLGDLDKARSTWQRIVDEDKDNPKAYITLAKALRQAGFSEEAAAATEAALEKDPHNFSLRFEYAQELAGQEEMGKAYEQLQLLLDLGPSEADKEKAKKEEEREKKVEQIQRARMGYERVDMFSPHYQPGQRYYYGNSLRGGSFEGVRPQVISTMAGMAENSIGIDEFIATYKKRVEENPNSQQAHEDLILVYENCNKQEEAHAATEALSALQPENVDILDKLAVQYSYTQQTDKALEKLAQIDVLQPTRKKSSDLARVYLYFRAEKKDEARTLLTSLIDGNRDDQSVLSMAVNLAAQYAEKDVIAAMQAKLGDLDPKFRKNIRQSLAYAYTETADTEQARKIFEEILFDDDDQDPYAYQIPRGRRVSIYAPRIGANNQNVYYGGGAYYQLRNLGITTSIDYARSSAIEQMTKLLDGEEEAAFMQRLHDEAAKFTTGEGAAARQRAWIFGQLLATQYVAGTDYAKAREVLAPFVAGKVDDATAYNLCIYIDEQEDKFDAMLENYAQLRDLYPGQLRDILRAETTTLMAAGRHEEAADRIRELARRGTPPNDLVAMIQQLKQEEKPQLAKALLEEQLAGLQRNAQALSMLAALYAEDNDYEKAMELAREAWEGKVRGGSGRNSNFYYYGGYYQSSGMSIDDNLRAWFQYAKSAGKKDELIAEFKTRLEQQPASVSAHEHLASLYSLDEDQDKAIELYKSLIEKRPHFVKAATALAQLYEQAGKYQEAIAQYESFIKSRPGLYSGMGWQIRNLYQRMGKGEDLAKIEEDMVKQARTPDQLQNLAWQFRNDGEFDKARELYLKIIDMQPGQSYYRTELAGILREMGRDDEALEVFAKWFDSPVMRTQGYIDQHTLAQMVGQYKAAGRLDELKAKNELTRIDKPDDLIAKSVDAHIAMAEHRFVDAQPLLLEVMKARQDGNAVNILINMGEYQDNALTVVEQLEKDGMMTNFWDQQRLAQVYLSAGDRTRAMEAYRKYADQQGQWGLENVMRGLYEFGLYEEAEDFYLKNRKKTREMDGIAMNMYMEGNGLEELVQEMLAQEIKGPAEGLVDNIVRDEKTSYAQALQMLTPLLEREPENKFLLNSIIDLHERNNKPAEALPWCEKLLALNEHDAATRRRFANTLVLNNREPEAFKLFDDLLAAKMNSDNALVAFEFYLAQGHVNRARALRDQCAATLDAKEVEQMDDRLARHEATLGKARACAERLKAAFEAAPDDKRFNACLSFLTEAGYLEEAYLFAKSQVDSGFVSNQIFHNDGIRNAVLQYGTVEDVVALLWKFVRHGDRWDREYQLREFVGGFQRVGHGRAFADAIRDRALAETPPFVALFAPLSDTYTQMGDRLSALEVTDVLLALQPGRRDHLTRKAGVLESMKRYDDALAIRAALPGAHELSIEATDTTNIARTYLAADRDAEALGTIEALAAWNKSPEIAGQIGMALIGASKFAEAIPYMEKGMRHAEFRNGNGVALMNAYLETGDTEKALALWRENKNQRAFREIYAQADRELFRPVAREILEARIQAFPAELGAYGQLGRILLKDGDTAGARALFDRALTAVPPTMAGQVAAGYGSILAAEGQLLPLLEAPPLDDPMLIRAIAAGYRSVPVAQRSDALRDNVLALPLTDVGDLMDLAAFFQGMEDKATASALWQRALTLESLEDHQRITILQALAEADALDDAAAQVHALLQQNPSLMRGNPALMAFIAKSGGPEALTLAMTALRERMPEGDNVTFFEKLAAYHGGDAADLSVLLAFAETATLEEWQWRHFAKLCQDAGNKDAEIVMLNRIADGGFGTSNRDRALAEICVIDAEAGRPVEAFARYRAISPAYGDREGLMESIGKTVAADHIPAMQAAVDEAIAARPGNLLVSDWMGEVAQLAEAAGAPIDLAAWATAAPLTPLQKGEALQWSRLYEGWQVSPRVKVDRSEAYFKEENTKAALTPEGAPLDLTGWVTIEPKQSLGLVNLGPVLFPEDDQFEESGAMAYKAIESPEGGPTDLGFASNIGNAQVWVNGVLVQQANSRSAVRPGLERFRVDLKPGVNHVIIKSTNANKRWLFCLGALEPRPPLAIPAAPAEAPAAEAPAIAAAG
ncbi:MAG: tetratricopeptide repeat protein [Candidatus Hydrogenedentes bacterium]|nr:tetratricopeptide repeat protein [Candidatus Hydrogenedentota bacterium]